jgi:para-nitrobenzyl esterase
LLPRIGKPIRRRSHSICFSFIVIGSDASQRGDAVGFEGGAKGAPVYQYLFTWQTPVLDGRPRAFHCAELAFCFDNIDRRLNMTGGGPEARALAARTSGAWIAFARSGNPNHPGLPKWPAYSAEKGEVMILDNKCEVRNDPDRAERRLITRFLKGREI